MKFSKDRPIHLKKIDFSDEYRLLADIVGKVLLCKISAHDAVPKQQLNIMGALVLKKKVDWASCLLKMIGYKYSHKENAYMRIMSQVLLHSFPDLCRSKGIPIPPGKRMSIALFSKWTRQIPKPGSIPERTPSPPNSPMHPSSPPPLHSNISSLPTSSTPIVSTTITTPILPTSSHTPAQPSSIPPPPPSCSNTPSSPPPPPLSPTPTHLEPSPSTDTLITQCIQSAAQKFQEMLDGHCSQLHSSIMHMQTQIDGVNASVQSLKSSVSSSKVTKSFLTSLAKKVKKGEKLDEEQLSSHKSLSHKSLPTSKSDSPALLKTIGNELVPELHTEDQITDVLSIAREATQQVVLFQGEASRAEREVEKETNVEKEAEAQGEPNADITEAGAEKETEEAEVKEKEVPSQGEQTAVTQGELSESPVTEKEQPTSLKTLVFTRKRKTPPTPPE